MKILDKRTNQATVERASVPGSRASAIANFEKHRRKINHSLADTRVCRRRRKRVGESERTRGKKGRRRPERHGAEEREVREGGLEKIKSLDECRGNKGDEGRGRISRNQGEKR